jgi:cell division protein FtsQ
MVNPLRQGPWRSPRRTHRMRRPPLPSRLPRPPLRATAAFLCVLGVLGALWLWLRDSPLVAVEDVTVTGLSGPDAGRVREALSDAARDMTTLHVRKGELRTAVDPYPAVLDVRTDPDFPHRLRIVVRERNPVGTVVAGDQRVPVAADGTLMRTTPSGGLPEIPAKALPGGTHAGEPGVRRALRVLAAAPPAMRARVTRVYMGEHGLTLPLRNGPTLYLGGSERLAAKWAAVATVLADPTSTGATYLDVRLPERPAAGGLEPPPDPPKPPATSAPAPGATQTTPAPTTTSTGP